MKGPATPPTDCADDAGVARHGGLGVDVQQTHVLDQSVRHGSLHLLGVQDGRAAIFWLRHDWIRVGRERPEGMVEGTQQIRVYMNML